MEGQNISIRTINTGRACACRHCICYASFYSFFSAFWNKIILENGTFTLNQNYFAVLKIVSCITFDKKKWKIRFNICIFENAHHYVDYCRENFFIIELKSYLAYCFYIFLIQPRYKGLFWKEFLAFYCIIKPMFNKQLNNHKIITINANHQIVRKKQWWVVLIW